MSDTVRVLVTASVLSAASLTAIAWKVGRLDPSSPERLIGEMRLGQWASVLLAAVGAIPIGLALAHAGEPLVHLDVAIGVMVIGLAGVVLLREPREGLLLLACAFVAHALVDIAHRPGWLSPALTPPWLAAGSAIFDVWISALCFWARRR